MSIHFVEYPRTLNISAATPVDASRPYSDPPAKQIALTTSRCCPLMPGEPPRTSIASDATFGKWKTVHPVGPSSYSATPTSSPGNSKLSARASAKSVRGASRIVSFVVRGSSTGPHIAHSAKWPVRRSRTDVVPAFLGDRGGPRVRSRAQRFAERSIGRDPERRRGDRLDDDERALVRVIAYRGLAHLVRVAGDLVAAHR